MADTKISALGALTTIAGSDEFVVVDKSDTTMDAAGTDKRYTWTNLLAAATATGTSFKNALDADTGITADGVTDDSANIVTLINNTTDDSIYFPPGTYLINRSPGASAPSTPGSPACQFTPTTSKYVIAHPDAIFKAGSSQDSDMFYVTTSTAGIEFTWLGGTYDAGLQFNSTSIPYDTEYVPNNVTTTSQDVANIWTMSSASTFRRWELGHMRTTSRAGSYASDLFDASTQHWRTGGGDTHIIGGVNEHQEAYVHDIVCTGAPDHAIYMTAGGSDTEATGAVVVERVSAYHCMGAVAVKRGMQNYTVRDCYAFNNPLPFQSSQPSGTSRRNADGRWINCVAEQYWHAFIADKTDRESWIGCEAIDGGVLDAADAVMTGSFAAQQRAFDIEGTTDLTIRQPKIDGTVAAWVTAGTKPVAFRIYSVASGQQTLDTTISDPLVDSIGSVGAEVAVASATDPDRTRVNGLIIGDDMSGVGITLLGSGSRASYGDDWQRTLTSDYTDANNDTTTRDVTGFGFPYRSGAWYEVEAVLHHFNDTVDTSDFTIQWTYSGTASGRVAFSAKSTTATGTTSATVNRSAAWNASTGIFQAGSLSTSATGSVTPMILQGRFTATTSGTLQLQVGKYAANGGTLTVQAGSYLRVRRVG